METVGSIDKNATLTVRISADWDLYDTAWLEINGEKITAYTEENGVYTFVYQVAVSSVADDFTIVLKATIAGVECSSEETVYRFERLSGAYTEESIATDTLENATATFIRRGVRIGDTVRLVYRVSKNTSTDTVLVLKYYGTDDVFASLKISEMNVENGIYVAEFDIDASDWEQFFSAALYDAEGNVISNTNYYSVSLFASKNINDDENDTLSNVLRVMMAYSAKEI